jgi:hypothetical protein
MLHRALDDFAVDLYGGDEEGFPESPFDGLLDEATQEKIDECGVDLNTIMNDYLSAVMDAAASENEADNVAFYLHFMEQLAEEGEETCTEEQADQYHKAETDFSKCIGMYCST